ncbi:MAG: dTMP kinase [Chitinivibrionales bacterium]|nr:dTMP kinase [Chitinivibrionales bacterium]
MSAGAFITFEGIDGCGKSTQLRLAEDALRRDGVDVMVTREPGGTAISEKIRELVMSAVHAEMSVECELLLYLAARAQHVSQCIRPAVESGRVVLCDRFQDATFAYQGYGRGLALEQLRAMNTFATGGLEPTLTLVFDVDVELSRERLRESGKVPDRMEAGPSAFHRRIREGYLALARQHADRMMVLRGDRPVEQIAQEVRRAIAQRLEERR